MSEWEKTNEDNWVMRMPRVVSLIVGVHQNTAFFTIWQGAFQLAHCTFAARNFDDYIGFAKKTALAIYHEMEIE